MNPLCFVCETPATHVCRHPKCQVNPYFCDQPCIKKISQTLHIHDGQTKSIHIGDLQQTIKHIQNKNDLTQHNDYFNSIRKKAEIMKNTIDRLVQEHISEIRETNQYQLLPNVRELLLNVGRKEANVLGKQISIVFGKEIYSNERVVDKKVYAAKQLFSHNLDAISKKLQKFLFEKTKTQKSQNWKQKAQTQYIKRNLQKSAEYYNNAIKLNSCSEQLYEDALRVVKELRHNKAIERYCKDLLQLNPSNIDGLQGLGQYYISQQQHSQAAQIYTKLINDPQCWNPEEYYKKRADCYLQSKRLKESLSDYQHLQKISSDPNQYSSQISWIYHLLSLQTQAKKEKQVGNLSLSQSHLSESLEISQNMIPVYQSDLPI